jgi:hypothetical protein
MYYVGSGTDWQHYYFPLDTNPEAGEEITVDFLYEVESIEVDYREASVTLNGTDGSTICGFSVSTIGGAGDDKEIKLWSDEAASETSGENWIDMNTQYCIRMVCTTATDDVEVWVDATGGSATDLSDCGQTPAHTHNGAGTNTDAYHVGLGITRPVDGTIWYVDNIEVSWPSPTGVLQ